MSFLSYLVKNCTTPVISCSLLFEQDRELCRKEKNLVFSSTKAKICFSRLKDVDLDDGFVV